MDTQQISAPPCAPPPVPGGSTPSAGVIHINFRHAVGFTVIGNHLAQHRGLSLVAIGLAVHIQSLPAGARISIKVLADRFPESETRIAAALRELEATGYLHRSRMRLPDGRITTRTVSYNQPGAAVSAGAGASAPTGATTGATSELRTRRSRPAAPLPVPPPPLPTREVALTPAPQPAPAPARTHAPQPASVPAPTARRTPPPPLPRPQTDSPELHHRAAALLADLRREAPQLLLSEGDVHTLAPGVATWLERAAHPDSIRRTLTADLPIPLKHPAKLLRHRITTLVPPPLPGTRDLAPLHHRVTPTPFQECDGCGRPFRSRTQHPTRCRDCRDDLHTAA
ncbi:helix-turn-helix domain-containing protein [Streptomyces sp. NPDC020403]|uniref:helix-turn-helix domain-containing protein n=1 Tax=unclassified Streptomyces TaxID=2593676 RepID=UPI0034071AE2